MDSKTVRESDGKEATRVSESVRGVMNGWERRREYHEVLNDLSSYKLWRKQIVDKDIVREQERGGR